MSGKISESVTVAQAIQMALAHHQAGRLPQAEAIYRQILKADPNHPDVLHFLGMIAYQAGKHEIAVEMIGRALSIKPDCAEAYNNLGNAFQAQGQLDEAIASFRKALMLKPDYVTGLYNLGRVFQAQGQMDEAVASYRKAISLKPNYAEAYNNLGNVFRGNRLLDEAVASFEKAIIHKPDYVEAYINLGNMFLDQGKYAEAIANFHKALTIKPDCVEALNSMGNVLKGQGQLKEALVSYRKALALKPDFAELYNNQGNALQALGQLENAVDSYRKSLELKPDYAEAHSNLGNALNEMGNFSAAQSSFIRAIELEPDQELFRLNHGAFLLAMGDFNGWLGHEARWVAPRMRKRHYPHPWWDGSDLSGKTILVWGEQGIGDELLFASLIPELSQRAENCIFECERRLVSLFARSFLGVEVIPRRTPPHPRTQGADITVQSPAGSLMRWLRPDVDSFPQHSGYLKADEGRVSHWKKRLDALGTGLKVGICWTSGDRSATAIKHCIGLEQWEPILRVEGALFINLQYTDCREELAQVEQRFGIKIQCWDDIDLKNDLDEVAALTTALDLVISVDTAVPKMAGALGRSVWMMTPRNTGWKELGTDHMPWFPDTKLFYREWNESWDGVIGAVAQELEMLIGGESQ